MRQITRGIWALNAFGNVFFVQLDAGNFKRPRWVLVDTGMPRSAGRIRRTAERCFGRGSRPECIVLTHGHFDHAGSAKELGECWQIPIYTHRLELPFLTGRSSYPPPDPTVGGPIGLFARMSPRRGYDLTGLIRPIAEDGRIAEMPGWRAVHTPGHTAGHISLFRELDRVLITGDAIVTMNHDSAVRMFIEQRKLHRPPAAFTTDWEAARESIQRLAELRPTLLITGHGRALSRPNLEQLLERFAVQVQPPMRGRYAQSPARCDESGVIELPPPVPDSFPKKAIVAALAVACGLIMGAALRRRKAA